MQLSRSALMPQPTSQSERADVRSTSLPRHHRGEAWQRAVRRFGRLHAATSIFNCARGLLCTGQARESVGTHKKHGTFCIANRSVLSERVAQGNLSQFNGLDLALPWFVARCSIQRSYGRAAKHFTVKNLRQVLLRFQPRVSAYSGHL